MRQASPFVCMAYCIGFLQCEPYSDIIGYFEILDFKFTGTCQEYTLQVLPLLDQRCRLSTKNNTIIRLFIGLMPKLLK